MTVKRYEFSITGAEQKQTIGTPNQRETPETLPVLATLGTSTGVIVRHSAAGVALVGASSALLAYSFYMVLQGVLGAALYHVTGQEPALSFDELERTSKNFIALLRENFSHLGDDPTSASTPQ